MRLRSLFLAVLSVLGACSSSPSLDREITAAPAANFTLIYSHKLRGQSQPCGCPQAPIGGLNRHFNLLSVWRKEAGDANLVYMAGGGTYTSSRQFAVRNPKLAFSVAQLIAEAQKLLGVAYVSPTMDDVALGVEPLKEIEKLSGATFVSANLAKLKGKGELLFKPYVEVSLAGIPYPVLVTGISHAEKGKSEAKVLAPAKAIASLLAKLDAKPRLIVVMSSLTRKENEQLAKAVPQIHILLGGEGENPSFEQLSETSLYSQPMSDGKELLRLKLTPRDSALTLFNPDVHYALWRKRENKKSEIVQIPDRMEGKPAATVKRMKKEIAEMTKDVAILDKLLAGDRAKTGLLYEQERQMLSVGYETPENPVSKLLIDSKYQSAASAPTTK